MTNDNAPRQGWWVGAAVAGLTAVVLLVAGTALYMLHRAYRRR